MKATSNSPITLTPSDDSNVADDQQRLLALASSTLSIEIQALQDLQNRIAQHDAQAFCQAAHALLHCQGRVVVSGIGKSGHIARKIAATLASTGTPAFFVHPAEAAHGDLGMITAADVLIAISYSGEAAELLAIMPVVKRLGVQLIAITGKADSNLAQLADIHLSVAVSQEACPLNLAPTASTTSTLALGDALAVAVLDARGFREEDFARSHPGGSLGRRLLTHVRDVMRQGEALPKVLEDTDLSTALFEITKKGMAMTTVVDASGCLLGVFTDGDLRRLLETRDSFKGLSIGSVMHRNPRTVRAEQLAVDAVQIMETYRINQLPVVDEAHNLIGALHIHDLTRAKVI